MAVCCAADRAFLAEFHRVDVSVAVARWWRLLDHRTGGPGRVVFGLRGLLLDLKGQPE